MDKHNEQRSEIRLRDEVAVFVDVDQSPEDENTEKVFVTQTLDISANGLQIASDKTLPLNSLHQLCIEVELRRFYLVGEVAWVGERDGEYTIGFRILESEYTQVDLWKAYICERLHLSD